MESLTAILEYGLDEIEPKSAGVASAMFLMAKPQLMRIIVDTKTEPRVVGQ